MRAGDARTRRGAPCRAPRATRALALRALAPSGPSGRRRRCRRPSCAGRARSPGTRCSRRGRTAGTPVTSRPSSRIATGGRPLEAGDHAQRRRLARARGAEHAEELAAADRRGRRRRPPRHRRSDLPQVLERDRGGRGHRSRPVGGGHRELGCRFNGHVSLSSTTGRPDRIRRLGAPSLRLGRTAADSPLPVSSRFLQVPPRRRQRACEIRGKSGLHGAIQRPRDRARRLVGSPPMELACSESSPAGRCRELRLAATSPAAWPRGGRRPGGRGGGAGRRPDRARRGPRRAAPAAPRHRIAADRGSAAGVAGGVGLAALYAGLAIGRMGLVAALCPASAR